MGTVFPQLLHYDDVALLCLRLMVAVIFFASGLQHAKHPVERAGDIGLSPGFTRVLGWVEMAGALGVAFGVLTQVAAFGLIAVMLGAIQRKLFVWHTGFWGEKASGWHYDLLLLVANLVIVTTGGGRLVLT